MSTAQISGCGSSNLTSLVKVQRSGSLPDIFPGSSRDSRPQMVRFPAREEVTSNEPSEEKTTPKTVGRTSGSRDRCGLAPSICKAPDLDPLLLRSTKTTDPSLNPTAATSPNGETLRDRPSAGRPLASRGPITNLRSTLRSGPSAH